jgi:hypothetical protein
MTTKKELQLNFLSLLFAELEKTNKEAFKILFDILKPLEFQAKQDFIKHLLQKPLGAIQTKIQETRSKRTDNKANGIALGNTLYTETSIDIAQLKSVLGVSDITFSSISDKLAHEILQCSIDYFNHYIESNTDPCAKAIDLAKKAQQLGIGNIAKQRCEETIDGIKKRINDKLEIDKQNIVETEIKSINKEIKKVQNRPNSILNALFFAKTCKPYLKLIKTKLGNNDEYYLMVSTSVSSIALGIVVSTVNEAMEKRNAYVRYKNWLNKPLYQYRNLYSFDIFSTERLDKDEVPFASEYSLKKLGAVISSAWKAIVLLGKMDMNNKQRKHYNKNKESLKKIYKENSNIIFFNNTPINFWVLFTGGTIIILLLIAIIFGWEGVGGILLIIAIFAMIHFINKL